VVTGWKGVVIGSNFLNEGMTWRHRLDGRPDLGYGIDVSYPAVRAVADLKHRIASRMDGDAGQKVVN
jgi:hypothetical protein